MLDHAIAAYSAGLCVMPPRGNGSKAPLMAWKSHQFERTTLEQIGAWYAAGEHRTGIGAVLGRISGNVELLEFDDIDAHREYVELAQCAGLGDVVERIESGYSETTPNGLHWLYRCDVVEGNTKLAQRLKSDHEREHEHDNVKTMIETRGEGGYVVLAPTHGTVHPSGHPYEMINGSYATIATITPIERERLFSLARTFDSMPRMEHGTTMPLTAPRSAEDGERPGDYYNRTRSWGDVLEPHGWRSQFTHHNETYWTRPGRERVTSATTNYAESDLLKVFSTSTPFDTARTYSRFGAYACLNFGGSFADAARAIRAEMPGVVPPLRTETPSSANGNGSGHSAADIGLNGTAESPELRRLRERLLDTDAILNMPEPTWLIDGILIERSVAVLWGASGSYKSFLALDWACCIASGAWWKTHKVEAPGKVLYVAAEGASGLGKRIKAWQHANNVHGLDRMAWIPEPVNLLDAAQGSALEQLCAEMRPTLVVIDTLARSMVGGDENSAQDMGIVLDRADRIKALTGATVIVIHHSTKEGSTFRGSGALKGNLDTEIEMRKDGHACAIYCNKQKDAEEFAPIALRLVLVDNSCVLSNVSRSLETNTPSSHALETTRKLFRETFSETGVAGAELRTVIEGYIPTSRASAYRLINELLSTGFITNKATTSRPFYVPGENFYLEWSSQRLIDVSDRLNPSGPSSHAVGGPLGPRRETNLETNDETFGLL